MTSLLEGLRKAGIQLILARPTENFAYLFLPKHKTLLVRDGSEEELLTVITEFIKHNKVGE